MIKILDCTLRDGGYVNEWKFGRDNIRYVIRLLTESNVDIVECGFLTNKVSADKDCSRFNTVEQIEQCIENPADSTKYVCMINFGEYDADDLPDYHGGALSGIRIAFHKKDLQPAMEFARIAKSKGYSIFIQPMVVISYSKDELLTLVDLINTLNPFSAYIVDSFGSMRADDVLALHSFFNEKLNAEIYLGFHSHNNLQLAYSNSLRLIEAAKDRNVIIDSSVFGMGRGAGNLCTELITTFLKRTFNLPYRDVPLLEIIDNCVARIYALTPWGYAIPYYISATNHCHPNYASFLMNKQTLNAQDINYLLSTIPKNKCFFFDKALIEKLYYDYLNIQIDDSGSIDFVKSEVAQKCILVLAPGASISTEADRIARFIKERKPYIVAVNFIPEAFSTDLVFCGNLKRMQTLQNSLIPSGVSVIRTSSINIDIGHVVNYCDLIDLDYDDFDNSGLMCLRLLIKSGVKKIYLAGFDGYDAQRSVNYASSRFLLNIEKQSFEQTNNAVIEQLKSLQKQAEIVFITPSLYLK